MRTGQKGKTPIDASKDPLIGRYFRGVPNRFADMLDGSDLGRSSYTYEISGLLATMYRDCGGMTKRHNPPAAPAAKKVSPQHRAPAPRPAARTPTTPHRPSAALPSHRAPAPRPPNRPPTAARRPPPRRIPAQDRPPDRRRLPIPGPQYLLDRRQRQRKQILIVTYRNHAPAASEASSTGFSIEAHLEGVDSQVAAPAVPPRRRK